MPSVPSTGGSWDLNLGLLAPVPELFPLATSHCLGPCESMNGPLVGAAPLQTQNEDPQLLK